MSRQVLLIAACAVFIVVRLMTIVPHGFTTDEQRSFSGALLTFDPYGHQPPPPSYPVYVAFGKLFFFFFRDAFFTLMALSVVAALAGFLLFARFGVLAAFAIYIAPPIRFLCSRPAPEPVALALFALALVVFRRGPAGGTAALPSRMRDGVPVLMALAVGVRPQMFFAVTAFVLFMGARSIAIYFGALLLCFVPVLQNVGIDRVSLFFASMEFGHGAPIRDFLLQPWWKATPLVILAAVAGAVRSRDWPLAAYTLAHIAYAATLGASNESVRPYVPAIAGIALLTAPLVSWARGAADDLRHRADVQRGGEH